jgi:Leucine-rich repeat (LRR) protein
LNGNAIGPEGFNTLLATQWITTITSLELADNRLGAAELSRLPSLRALDFSDNALDSIEKLPAGLQRLQLARCGLTRFPATECESLLELDLGDNRLGTAGAVALAEEESLSQLRSLDLRFNDIEDEGVHALCRLNAPLESLNLRGNRITETGANAIATARNFGSVVHLDLGANPIGDSGAVALMRDESLCTLERLSLANCGITDAGVTALVATGALGGLRELSLAWNPFGDVGVKALASCSDLAGLRHLDLTGTRIGFSGAIAIADPPNLFSLQSLILGENDRLPADGVALIHDRFGKLPPP